MRPRPLRTGIALRLAGAGAYLEHDSISICTECESGLEWKRPHGASWCAGPRAHTSALLKIRGRRDGTDRLARNSAQQGQNVWLSRCNPEIVELGLKLRERHHFGLGKDVNLTQTVLLDSSREFGVDAEKVALDGLSSVHMVIPQLVTEHLLYTSPVLALGRWGSTQWSRPQALKVHRG